MWRLLKTEKTQRTNPWRELQVPFPKLLAPRTCG